MSLFRSTVRPPAVLSDEAVERYLAALRAEVDPDPAFRRRLRGVVLNQYVASREAAFAGLVPRAMGRLGRSVLYASFALGVSVTGVMAASEVAVPGDVLYPVKRAIEDMRVHVLPPEFDDELVIHELNERFSELAVLVDRDETARAEALATEVAADYAAVITRARTDGAPLDRRTELVESLIAQLPEQARVTLDQAIATVGAGDDATDHGAPDGGTPASEDPGQATGGGNSQGAAGTPGRGTGGGNGEGGAGAGQGSSGSGGNSSGSSGDETSSHGPGSGDGNGSGNGNGGNSRGGSSGGKNAGGQGQGDGHPDDDDPSTGEGNSDEASPTPKPATSPKPKKSPTP